MQLVRIDGVLWKIYAGEVSPLCPVHRMEMDFVFNSSTADYRALRCADCEKVRVLPRDSRDEIKYVLRKVESRDLKSEKVLNIDGESVPLAEDRVDSVDGKYFVKAILTDSRAGQRLVVYAGEKGNPKKTQIFVEPEVKKLAFDPNDLHPNDIFTKLTAEFDDGSSQVMNKN